MPRPFKGVPLAAAAFFLIPAVAGAGPLQDKAASAEKALGENHAVDALEIMREALIETWLAAPLSIRTAIFVTEPVEGYGRYTSRADNVFSQREPLLIYLEPSGFDWKQEGGEYISALTVDFVLSTREGKVLGGQKEFGRFDSRSHVRNVEYLTNVTLRSGGVPPGDYVLDLTLHDLIGNGTASVSLPFSIK